MKSVMTKRKELVDFRQYRPASVLVFDLVRHSKRDKAAIHSIQVAMKDAFSKAIAGLGINDVYFNYTGDGYVCTLLGDSSARLMDFINASVPRLVQALQPYKQDFRVGVDFGLVHFSEDALTGGREHFDLPGIRAARLEAAAVPGEVLCTETVHDVFAHHYPGMFSRDAKAVKTKDREVFAYEVTPIDTQQVQKFFSRYLFRTGQEEVLQMGSRTKILVVDDEPGIPEALKETLSLLMPQYRIVGALSGEEALESFKPGTFAVVLTDIVMPGMSGIELTRRILALDPEQIIIVMTGYCSTENAKESLAAGAMWFFAKPLSFNLLREVIQVVLVCGSPRTVHNRIEVLCDDPGQFLWLLQQTSERLSSILRQVSEADDSAHSLLRHKAKHIVRDFVDTLKPGGKVVDLLSIANTQLNCIDRLSRIVSRMTGSELEQQLEQLCEDLKKANPNIEFELICSLRSHFQQGIPFATTLILVIAELLDNAISAIGDSGRIEIRVSYLMSSGMLHVAVRDSGPGIPKEVAPSIFEEGMSTKGIGRGLGLLLVRTAVESLHGKIEFGYRDGTVFRASVPVS